MVKKYIMVGVLKAVLLDQQIKNVKIEFQINNEWFF